MNETKYFKLLKLVTGEDIICTTNENLENILPNSVITIMNPAIVQLVRYPRGAKIFENYVIQPWVRYAVQEKYTIMTNNIVAVTDLNAPTMKCYVNFLNIEKSSTIDIDRMDDNESYENKLENFFKELSSIIGDDDAEEKSTTRNTKTLH